MASLSRRRTLPTAATTYSGPHLFALQVAVGGQLLVEHDLRDAGAVAEIEKDKVAVVATPVDPAHENHLLPSVGGAHVAAKMRPFKIA